MQYALEVTAKKIGTTLRLPEVQWVFVTATVSEAEPGSMSKKHVFLQQIVQMKCLFGLFVCLFVCPFVCLPACV